MATCTFDRKLEITDYESAKKLVEIMLDETPLETQQVKPFTIEDLKEQERTEKLLRQYFSHSGK